MIKISIVSYNNEAPPQPMSAIFDATGGTLGRSDDNFFVLPDPSRYVSRLQASVRSDGQRHLIVNISQANPMLINGEEIDPETEYELKIGDEIHIGLYLLRAESHLAGAGNGEGPRPVVQSEAMVAAVPLAVAVDRVSGPAKIAAISVDPLNLGLATTASANQDPFSDLFGDAAPSAGSPVAPAVESLHVARPPTEIVAPPALPPDDPLGLNALLASSPSSPSAASAASPSLPFAEPRPHTQNGAIGFDDLLTGSIHRSIPAERSAPIIPADFNPFSMPSQAARNSADPLADMARDGVTLASLEADTNHLENLLSAASDSFGDSTLDGQDLYRESGNVDPLALFSTDPILPVRAAIAVGKSVTSNHVPEVNAYFALPQLKRAEPVAASVPSAAGTAAIAPTVAPAPAVATQREAMTPHEAVPRAAPQDAPAAPGANLNLVDGDAMMQAFFRGAGLAATTTSGGMTPELMEMLGTLLGASMQGAVELIASRALVKREVQVEMTVIVPKDNNPLKFLPDSQTVLMQMLRPKMPGFMGPVEAVQDAFEDLRAHQIGVVAGMRAALGEVLRRFNPQQLEEKLQGRRLLDRVMPAKYKARLWDTYGELFDTIYLEAQDDFQTLFGKAFVTAYESEIERFRQERPT